jgi:hypothetical protein
MFRAAFALFAATAALASPPTGDEAMLRDLLATLAGAETATRVEAVSAHFVGRPYLLGGLGEGESGKYDRDPEWRFDAFDCTTFVETVTALALAPAYDEFPALQRRIRYRDGVVDFTRRNHFPSLDWIPNNVQAGFYRDITRELGPVEIARAVVDKPRWYETMKLTDLNVPGASPAERARLLDELRAEGRRFQAEETALDYVPFNAMDDAFYARVPSGAVVNVVRPNWDLVSTHENVTHQGFAIRRGGALFFRHASSAASTRKVVTVPFADYVAQARKNPAVKGLNFLGLR